MNRAETLLVLGALLAACAPMAVHAHQHSAVAERVQQALVVAHVEIRDRSRGLSCVL